MLSAALRPTTPAALVRGRVPDICSTPAPAAYVWCFPHVQVQRPVDSLNGPRGLGLYPQLSTADYIMTINNGELMGWGFFRFGLNWREGAAPGTVTGTGTVFVCLWEKRQLIERRRQFYGNSKRIIPRNSNKSPQASGKNTQIYWVKNSRIPNLNWSSALCKRFRIFKQSQIRFE